MTKEGTARARVYDAGTAEEWKARVIESGSAHRPTNPLDGPLAVTLTFRLRRPQAHYSKRGGLKAWAEAAQPIGRKLDLDNLAKAVLDALTLDQWWRDDGQIVRLELSKVYADGPAGVDVHVAWWVG